MPTGVAEAVAHATARTLLCAVIGAEARLGAAICPGESRVAEALGIPTRAMVAAVVQALLPNLACVTAESGRAEALSEAAQAMIVAIVRARLHVAARFSLRVRVAVAHAGQAQSIPSTVVWAGLVRGARGTHPVGITHAVAIDASSVTTAVVLTWGELRGHGWVGEVAHIAVVAHPAGLTHTVWSLASAVHAEDGAGRARLKRGNIVVEHFIVERAAEHPEIGADRHAASVRALVGCEGARGGFVSPYLCIYVQGMHLAHGIRGARHNGAAQNVHGGAIRAEESEMVLANSGDRTGGSDLFPLVSISSRSVEYVKLVLSSGAVVATEVIDSVADDDGRMSVKSARNVCS